MIFYGDFERLLRRRFREVFAKFSRSFSEKTDQNFFGNDSFHRCDRFRQIFIQIGAILAIFRPFEVSATTTAGSHLVVHVLGGRNVEK